MSIEVRRRSFGPLAAGLVAVCALLSGAPPAPAQQPGDTARAARPGETGPAGGDTEAPGTERSQAVPGAPERDGQGAAITTAQLAGDAAALPSTTDLVVRLSQGLRGAESEVGTLVERARAAADRLEEQRRQIGQLALLRGDLERQLAETTQE